MGETDRTDGQFDSVSMLPPMYVVEDAAPDELDEQPQEDVEESTDEQVVDEVAETDEVDDDASEAEPEKPVEKTAEKTAEKPKPSHDKKIEQLGYQLQNLRSENEKFKAELKEEIKAFLADTIKPTTTQQAASDDVVDAMDELDDDDVLTVKDFKAMMAKQASGPKITETDVEKMVAKRLEDRERQTAERSKWIDEFPETHQALHELGVDGGNFLKRYQESVSVLDGVNLPADELEKRVTSIYKSVVSQMTLEAKAAQADKAKPVVPRKSTRGTGITTKGASASRSLESASRDEHGLPRMFVPDE